MDAKALQDDLQSLGLISSLAKPEIGKEILKRRTRPCDDRAKGVMVTRREGREASERRSMIGEDERQPVMARLAAR